MGAMRPIAPVLLLLAVASAQDPFAAVLERFEKAVTQTLKPEGHAKVDPAVDELVATGDVRAIEPLLRQLVATYEREDTLYKALRDVQRSGAEAGERATELDEELGFLRLKEQAGDASVGPKIRKILDEQEKLARVFHDTREATVRLEHTVTFVQELREILLKGCARVLNGLKGEKFAAGLESLRRSLDLANRDQALVMVRLLRMSATTQAEPQLLDILADEKADGAVLRAAQYALAACMTRRGAETLLRIWERDPEGRGKHARNALSLAAKRNLADLEAARAWVAGLGG
jgi:hypothetical protein